MKEFVRMQDVKKTSPHVRLDDGDLGRAEKIADKRVSTMGEDESGEKTYRGEMSGGSVTTWEAYYKGAMGEVAAEYIFGVDLDETVTPTGDEGEDFIIDGKVIDLKTRDHHDPVLPVLEKKIQDGVYEKTDVFFLAYKEGSRDIYFLGYASFEEIMEQEPERFPDKYLNRYIHWRDIHRFSTEWTV